MDILIVVLDPQEVAVQRILNAQDDVRRFFPIGWMESDHRIISWALVKPSHPRAAA